MKKLTHADLWKLEDYSRERHAFRAKVIAHKKTRKVHLGPHLTLIFEDRMTIQYQVQEMLRIERIFEAAAIDEELGAYNPLIPDGANLKATLLIEYDDVEMRKRELAKLRDVEHHVRVLIEGVEPVDAIADEDMDRSNEEKTSAVHFLRFELPDDARRAVKAGARVTISIEHPQYPARTELPEAARTSLASDLR